MGFNAYFLIVWDFCKWARDHGVVVGPGRGSAAGSIVAYTLRSRTSTRSATTCCSSAS
jgi:DNA polymerase-3 subunit alpha